MIYLILIGIILVIVGFIVWYWLLIYNGFQTYRNKAENELSGIEVALQERFYNLGVIVKVALGYNIHENKTFKEVSFGRGDGSLDDKVREANLGALRVKAVVERYPILKADKLSSSLIERDSYLELRLRTSRLTYNESVLKYNTYLSTFPENLVGKFHGFTKLSYLKFEEEKFKPEDLFK